jgi:oligopeptide transport system permease protein
VNVVYGLPFLFLAILLISLAGPSSGTVLLAIAGVQWLTMARTVRALFKSLRKAPWAEAAEVMGCGPVRLAVAHLVPNARRPILAWAALLVPASIKEEAFLSFIGLGVQAPRASLGTLIADGAGRLSAAPWQVAAPAAALVLLVLCITLAVEENP